MDLSYITRLINGDKHVVYFNKHSLSDLHLYRFTFAGVKIGRIVLEDIVFVFTAVATVSYRAIYTTFTAHVAVIYTGVD